MKSIPSGSRWILSSLQVVAVAVVIVGVAQVAAAYSVSNGDCNFVIQSTAPYQGATGPDPNVQPYPDVKKTACPSTKPCPAPNQGTNCTPGTMQSGGVTYAVCRCPAGSYDCLRGWKSGVGSKCLRVSCQVECAKEYIVIYSLEVDPDDPDPDNYWYLICDCITE